MANTNAFTLSGSTPKLATNTVPSWSTPTTPAAKALSTAATPTVASSNTPAFNAFSGVGNTTPQVKTTPSIVGQFGTYLQNQRNQSLGVTPPVAQQTLQIPGALSPSKPVQQATSQPLAVSGSGSGVNLNVGYNAGVTQQPAPTGTQVSSPQTQGQTPTYPGLIGSLSTFNPFANPSVSQAYNKAQDIQQQLEQSKTNEANAEATNRLNPIPIGDQTGREAVLRNQYLAQQNALSSQGAAQASIYGAGFTGTGQQLSGLNSATGLAQPQLGQVGTQSYYNPLTGLPSSGTGANTPFGGGVAQGNVSLGQQYAQNVSAFNQGTAVKNQINDYLASNPTLNPSAFTDVNSVLQLLNGKVSNPQYQTLSNMLSEYVSTLAPILGVGGDTTNLKTEIAQGFVNAHQSGQSISQVLNSIEGLAQAKLNAQQGGSNGAASSVPTGSSLYSF